MYAQKEKPKENKSKAVANSVTQKKSNGKQGFGFVDNRPEAIAQRKLQGMVCNSLQVESTGNGIGSLITAQRVESNIIQMKRGRVEDEEVSSSGHSELSIQRVVDETVPMNSRIVIDRDSASDFGDTGIIRRPSRVKPECMAVEFDNEPGVYYRVYFNEMSIIESDESKSEEIDPISKIAIVDLAKLKPKILQNSRAKKIYLFDKNGDSTTETSTATFMIDTEMDSTEYQNYQKVESWGVRVPKVYGKTKLGFAIVQWIPKQTTVGGAGGRRLWPAVKNSMFLDEINSKPFNLVKWTGLLSDVNELIDLKYTSPDLQFMIEEDTGHIYIMDLEANNAPSKSSSADEKLLELKEFLEKSIEENSLHLEDV